VIGQCLSNKNENATVAKKAKFLQTEHGLTAHRGFGETSSGGNSDKFHPSAAACDVTLPFF